MRYLNEASAHHGTVTRSLSFFHSPLHCFRDPEADLGSAAALIGTRSPGQECQRTDIAEFVRLCGSLAFGMGAGDLNVSSGASSAAAVKLPYDLSGSALL
jgi:hypothetical protein